MGAAAPSPTPSHADLAPAAVLTEAHQQRSTSLVEFEIGQRERLLDAQAGAPQDDDHRPDPEAVAVIRWV
jgi:hypothetical protein